MFVALAQAIPIFVENQNEKWARLENGGSGRALVDAGVRKTQGYLPGAGPSSSSDVRSSRAASPTGAGTMFSSTGCADAASEAEGDS